MCSYYNSSRETSSIKLPGCLRYEEESVVTPEVFPEEALSPRNTLNAVSSGFYEKEEESLDLLSLPSMEDLTVLEGLTMESLLEYSQRSKIPPKVSDTKKELPEILSPKDYVAKKPFPVTKDSYFEESSDGYTIIREAGKKISFSNLIKIREYNIYDKIV